MYIYVYSIEFIPAPNLHYRNPKIFCDISKISTFSNISKKCNHWYIYIYRLIIYLYNPNSSYKVPSLVT